MTATKLAWACLATLAGGVLAAGCAANELVDDLAEHGVRPDTTAGVRFIGSEADFGTTKVQLLVTDKEAIKTLWRLIEAAKPADVWHGSGYRRLELYSLESAEKPAAVLEVNAGDLCHVAGSRRHYYSHDAHKMRGVFRCKGLYNLMTEYLAAEHKRRQAQPR